MESYFSISEAAKIVGLTSETLRHYDRIDLVKPCKKDQWSGYRYYSEQEIVRLNTIQALRCMDLSLKEIKKVLEYDNLEEIVEFLKRAEQKANQKIEQLKYAKSKIQLAMAILEKVGLIECKLIETFLPLQSMMFHMIVQLEDIFYQQIDERVILLSNSMQEPTLSNLWNYHSHFYQQTNDLQKQNYLFEDLAGIYTKDGKSSLFAVCIEYPNKKDLVVLPSGTYICANCSEEDREDILKKLLNTIKQKYEKEPEFIVQMVVISGILQWNYQIQIFLGEVEEIDN
mgnify:CR=1 FL=1